MCLQFFKLSFRATLVLLVFTDSILDCVGIVRFLDVLSSNDLGLVTFDLLKVR